MRLLSLLSFFKVIPLIEYYLYSDNGYYNLTNIFDIINTYSELYDYDSAYNYYYDMFDDNDLNLSDYQKAYFDFKRYYADQTKLCLDNCEIMVINGVNYYAMWLGYT